MFENNTIWTYYCKSAQLGMSFYCTANQSEVNTSNSWSLLYSLMYVPTLFKQRITYQTKDFYRKFRVFKFSICFQFQVKFVSGIRIRHILTGGSGSLNLQSQKYLTTLLIIGFNIFRYKVSLYLGFFETHSHVTFVSYLLS